MNSTENKITVSYFFIKQLTGNLNKNIKIKTLSNAIKHFFIYKTNIVNKNTDDATPSLSFNNTYRNLAINPDNVSSYIVELLSKRYNGIDKQSEIDSLKNIQADETVDAMLTTLFIKNKTQFSNKDTKDRDIESAKKSDIYKMNTNMLHMIYSVSRIYGLEETKVYKTRTIIPQDKINGVNNGNNSFFVDDDDVIELLNTINKDSHLSLLQTLSMISLLKLLPQKVNDKASLWQDLTTMSENNYNYKVPNFANIKFLSLKPNKYFTDIITTLYNVDPVKDTTNINIYSGLLKKLKYINKKTILQDFDMVVNSDLSRMLTNDYKHLSQIFNIQNINSSKKVDKVTVTVHFSFEDGNDELVNLDLNSVNILSSLFVLKNNNNTLSIKPKKIEKPKLDKKYYEMHSQ